MLKTRGISETRLRLVRSILSFAGGKGSGDSSSSDLLSADNVKLFTKKVIKGLKGVENIYTQHTPLLKEVVEELARGKLKPAQYPYLGTVQLNERPKEVIVFMIGGATYEESLAIHNLNKSLPNVDILLGSSSVHNTTSFLEEVRTASTPASKASSLTKAL
jgi:vacuolar protein sorting-associated protein 45